MFSLVTVYPPGIAELNKELVLAVLKFAYRADACPLTALSKASKYSFDLSKFVVLTAALAPVWLISASYADDGISIFFGFS